MNYKYHKKYHYLLKTIINDYNYTNNVGLPLEHPDIPPPEDLKSKQILESEFMFIMEV